jgi:hypothetical protein
MEYGFSNEGEKLTPSEKLTHFIETYGDLNSTPNELKEKIQHDMAHVGDTRTLEEVVKSMQEENLMNAA